MYVNYRPHPQPLSRGERGVSMQRSRVGEGTVHTRHPSPRGRGAGGEGLNGGNMGTLSEQMSTVGETILADLEGVNAARERALAESRQIVRLSANTIRAVHRHDFDEADELLSEARRMN